MALYKYADCIRQTDGSAFDKRCVPGTPAQWPGIYHCDFCGREIAIARNHSFPPQNHPQSTRIRGDASVGFAGCCLSRCCRASRTETTLRLAFSLFGWPMTAKADGRIDVKHRSTTICPIDLSGARWKLGHFLRRPSIEFVKFRLTSVQRIRLGFWQAFY